MTEYGTAQVLVVGAGISGLVAARRLAEVGHTVTVLEEASTVGGRIVTRQVGAAAADSGAQFFTARRAPFVGLLAAWRYAGVPVRVWAHGWVRAASAADGPAAGRLVDDMLPRYSVEGGLGQLIDHVATGLDVRVGTRVRRVTRSEGRVAAEDDAGARWEADAAVLTPPLPRALALLGQDGLDVPERLREVVYEPCIAVLAELDSPPAVPEPGGVQFAGGAVAFLADNVAKGTSQVPCVTVHASAEWSAAHAADDDASVAATLLAEVAGWLGQANAVSVAVERWSHARPTAQLDDPAVALPAADDAVVIAGDGFIGALVGPTMEGAAMSGLAAADLLLTTLKGR